MTEQEVVDQIEAELEKLSVADVLLHTATTVASLAYRRLAPADRDLEQVKLAIDSLCALLPLLADELPGDLEQDFRRAIADLQLAYANAVGQLQ